MAEPTITGNINWGLLNGLGSSGGSGIKTATPKAAPAPIPQAPPSGGNGGSNGGGGLGGLLGGLGNLTNQLQSVFGTNPVSQTNQAISGSLSNTSQSQIANSVLPSSVIGQQSGQTTMSGALGRYQNNIQGNPIQSEQQQVANALGIQQPQQNQQSSQGQQPQVGNALARYNSLSGQPSPMQSPQQQVTGAMGIQQPSPQGQGAIPNPPPGTTTMSPQGQQPQSGSTLSRYNSLSSQPNPLQNSQGSGSSLPSSSPSLMPLPQSIIGSTTAQNSSSQPSTIQQVPFSNPPVPGGAMALGQNVYQNKGGNQPNLPTQTNAMPISISNIQSMVAQAFPNNPTMQQLATSQAAQESGLANGKPSVLAIQGNNLFGIKGTGTAGSISIPTQEYINGKPQTVNQQFAAYSSPQESMQAYAKLMNSPRYQSVLQAQDLPSAAKAVQQSGYATDPNYAQSLIGINSKLTPQQSNVPSAPKTFVPTPANMSANNQHTSSSIANQAITQHEYNVAQQVVAGNQNITPDHISSATQQPNNPIAQQASVQRATMAAQTPGATPWDIAQAYNGKGRQNDNGTLDAYFNKQLGSKMWGGAGHTIQNTPWCAAFAGSVLAQAGIKGTGSLSAKSYLNFGTPTNTPSKGDIVVFNDLTGKNDPSHGHVAFVDHVDKSSGLVYAFGGNESGKVTTKAYPLSKVAGFRIPPNAQEIQAKASSIPNMPQLSDQQLMAQQQSGGLPGYKNPNMGEQQGVLAGMQQNTQYASNN